MGAERRDTPSSKETKIVLRPGYKLQISLPSPANARLLVYPACRGCLRFFPPSPSSLRPPFNSGSPVPSQEFPQGAPGQRRDTPSRLSSPNGNCRKFHRERILPRLASYRTCSNSAGRDKRPLFLALSVSSMIPRSLLVGARKDSSMIPREFDDFELRMY